MPPKKPAGQIVQAEVALQQSLKNCLVNLPASLVSVLVNANAVCHFSAAFTLLLNHPV
jgi:peroxin-1